MQKIASYLEDVRDPEVKRMHRFGSFGKIWKYKKVLYDGIFSLNFHTSQIIKDREILNVSDAPEILDYLEYIPLSESTP